MTESRVLDCKGRELSVGDRVRSTGAETPFLATQYGEVSGITGGPPNVAVRWDGFRGLAHGHAVDLMWRCPDLELIETTIETEKKILAVLEADLPDGARVMDAAAITEEIEHGREVTVQDDELAPQETYDAHEKVLDAMVDTGALVSSDALGMKVYGVNYQSPANRQEGSDG